VRRWSLIVIPIASSAATDIVRLSLHDALPICAWIEYNKVEPDPGSVQLRKMSLLLSSDRSVMEHAEFIAQNKIDLVVVDTMIRAAEGLVLENTSEAAKIIAQLDNLRSLRTGCTIVALHHPPESEPDKPGGAYPIRGNV